MAHLKTKQYWHGCHCRNRIGVNRMNDLISRQAAIDALNEQIEYCNKALGSFDISSKDEYAVKVERASLETYKEQLENLPSVQPFHNITMNDVLKYIDGMSEDVWQEFTACLECRGWELQRRTAKWCGG